MQYKKKSCILQTKNKMVIFFKFILRQDFVLLVTKEHSC